MTMGYIREPSDVDFVVDPTPLTIEERKKISEIIAHFKSTGRKMKLLKSSARTKVVSSSKRATA
jgi:hypothetical protein